MQNGHSEARYIEFKPLPEGSLTEDGHPALNKYSAALTRDHDFPGAQVLSFPPPDIIACVYICPGYALRSWSSRQICHEKFPSRWHRVSVVGRKSVQVRTPALFQEPEKLTNTKHASYVCSSCKAHLLIIALAAGVFVP